MKSPRETCKRCGIALEAAERDRGFCLRCARQELDYIKRFFRIRLIAGLIMAVAVFLVLGWMRTGYDARGSDFIPPMLQAAAALSTAQRALWVVLAFGVPFGYFHQIKTKGAPINEAYRADIVRYNRAALGRGDLGGAFALSGSESAGIGLLIMGILTAPVVGPFHAIYRLIRAAKLRRYIAKAARPASAPD